MAQQRKELPAVRKGTVFEGGGHSPNGHVERRPRRPAPILDSIREIQAAQAGFIEQGRGGRDLPESVVVRMHVETAELGEAVIKGDRQEVAGELADIFLLMTRIAHQYGIPLDVAISDKIARNAEKYPPAIMAELRAGGLGPDAAERVLKERWDRDRDKAEFSRIGEIRAELAEISAQQDQV